MKTTTEAQQLDIDLMGRHERSNTKNLLFLHFRAASVPNESNRHRVMDIRSGPT